MGRIHDAAKALFEEEEWVFTENTESEYLAMMIAGSRVNWRCYAVALESIEVFKFLVDLPERVPGDQRAPVADFITRANWGMNVGAFEMDMADGEVRFRAGVDLENSTELRPLIRQCIAAAISTSERYYPGFMGVLHGGHRPHEAIATVEGSASAGPAATPDATSPA